MHQLTIKLVAVLLVALACSAMAGPIQVQGVSAVNPGLSPAGGNGDSCLPILSADGRYVLFASAANNLMVASNGLPIPSLVPARFNVYLRDRVAKTTMLVSANSNGVAGGNGDSFPVALSTNGQFALFESSASDLVGDDTNNATDVYLRDLVAGTTVLVSTATNQLAGNRPSRNPVMTPDARFVAFVSEANNLVPSDNNAIADVFVRDLQTQITTRVSVGATSTNVAALVPACSSESPEITPDGRFIAFSSTATNLVPGVQTVGDVYVHDRLAGTNLWASSGMRAALQAAKGTTNGVCYNVALSADGKFIAYQASRPGTNSGIILRYSLEAGVTDLVHTNATVPSFEPEEAAGLDMTEDGRFVAFAARSNGVADATIQVWDAALGLSTLASVNLSGTVTSNSLSLRPVLDASGRYVVFLSNATNLVTNPVSGDWHVYQRDLLSATTMLVDAVINGESGLIPATTVPGMSVDARFVAFESADASLVSGDNNHHLDVFVRDLDSGTNDLISAHDPALGSLTPNRPSLASAFSANGDGRYIAFASEADNIVPGDTNGFRDVFMRDLAGNTNILVSVGPGGTGGNGLAWEPAISGDGRFVAFTANATNLVAGDANKSSDVFVRDLQAGTTVLVSVKANGSGTGNKASYSPVLSADGRWLLFRSQATDLVGGPTSGSENVFVRDLAMATNYALTTAGGGDCVMTPSGRFVAFVAGIPGTRLHVWDSASGALVFTNNTASVNRVAISPDGNLIAYLTTTPLWIADRAANTNWVASSGTFVSGIVPRFTLRFSADGKWLTYARLIAPWRQTFLYDVPNRVETLISHELNSSIGADGDSDLPDISPDGRLVAYGTTATNIIAGANGFRRQIVLYDRLTGLNTLFSPNRSTSVPADDYSMRAGFSVDGQTLLIQSWASDLAAGDFNRSADVFARPILTTVVLPPTAGQGPWLCWPFLPGNNYEVQFKNSLEDSLWQTLPGSYTNVANKAWLQDPSPAIGNRFYRVNVY